MENLKYKLFSFKQNLAFEQSDIANVVEGHIRSLDNISEKKVVISLNEKLGKYTYDGDVKTLLESLNADMANHELVYELKDLYRTVESKDNGNMYQHPLNILLECINLDNDADRMTKILNELSIHNWIPEVKLFLHNLTTNPEERNNLMNGGEAKSVYTIVETVENGHVAFLKDSWFLLNENGVEKTTLEEHVKDEASLSTLRTLESALRYATVSADRIDFKISESLVVGISPSNNDTYINEEKTNKETTLDSLFASPLIPIVNKNFFPLIKEVSNNTDKFVELDVVKHVTNLVNPHLENFVFNYKGNVYLYNCDNRTGTSFYEYESALECVNDVKNSLSYDLTYFMENLLSDEVKIQRRLEDKTREISIDIEDLDRNIDKIQTNIQMLGESVILTEALNGLIKEKEAKEAELVATKTTMYKEVIRKK